MLDIVRGDIWDYHPEHWIVITTNLGWRRDGTNVMGAGIAKQAAQKYPLLPVAYGVSCSEADGKVFVEAFYDYRLILLPTKRLNRSNPHLSWQYPSDLETIDSALVSLVSVTNWMFDVYIPPPGCGNGGLALEQVMPLLEKHLITPETRYHLVLR